MVKSACGIEAVYMCFNGTGIWGGETISRHKGFVPSLNSGANAAPASVLALM